MNERTEEGGKKSATFKLIEAAFEVIRTKWENLNNKEEFPEMTEKIFEDGYRAGTLTLCNLLPLIDKLSEANPVRARVNIGISAAAFILLYTMVKMSNGKLDPKGKVVLDKTTNIAETLNTLVKFSKQKAEGSTARTLVMGKQAKSGDEITQGIMQYTNNRVAYSYDSKESLGQKMEKLYVVLASIFNGSCEAWKSFYSCEGDYLFELHHVADYLENEKASDSAEQIKYTNVLELFPKLIEKCKDIISEFQARHGGVWVKINQAKEFSYQASDMYQESGAVWDTYRMYLEHFDQKYANHNPVINPASSDLSMFIRLKRDQNDSVGCLNFWKDPKFLLRVKQVTKSEVNVLTEVDISMEENERLNVGRSLELTFADLKLKEKQKEKKARSDEVAVARLNLEKAQEMEDGKKNSVKPEL